MTDYQTTPTGWIRSELSEGVLVLTLDRPDKLNAFTGELGVDLAALIRTASEDDAVRAVILTGAGRAFCAGADISDGADSFGGGSATTFGTASTPRDDNCFIEAMYRSRKPLICAINGPAVGVGATLTLPFDIRIASDRARFGFVFARRGLVPEAGAAWFLPRIVGLGQAMRWCYAARLIDAAEALRGGLVNEIVADGELLDRANAIAREIVDGTAPIAVALTRQLFWRFAGEADPLDLFDVDAALNRELGASEDVREGVRAFMEKRAPVFPGRVSQDLPATGRALLSAED